MRLNRVLAMLGLTVVAGMGLIWVESQNLRLKQKLTELYHQRELLTEQHARLRVAVNRLAAPNRVLEGLSEAAIPLEEPRLPVAQEPRASVPPYLQR